MNKLASTPRRRITAALVLANLCVLTLHFGGRSHATRLTAAQQAPGRAVVKAYALDNEPVELGGVKVKDRAVNFNDRFEGEETWLKEVTLKLKNRSKKPITYLRLDLNFPETASTGSVLFHQIFVGRRPEVTSSRSNPPLLLMPNQSTEVSLASQFDELKKLIELRRGSVGSVSEVVVRLGEAMFEDGTLYSGGEIFRRNPDQSSPRKWVIVNDGQGAGQGN